MFENVVKHGLSVVFDILFPELNEKINANRKIFLLDNQKNQNRLSLSFDFVAVVTNTAVNKANGYFPTTGVENKGLKTTLVSTR